MLCLLFRPSSRSVKYVRPYNINDRVVCRRHRRSLLLAIIGIGIYHTNGDETRAPVPGSNSLKHTRISLCVFDSECALPSCDIIILLYRCSRTAGASRDRRGVEIGVDFLLLQYRTQSTPPPR